jgi:DNA-binding CsgD family transcriptional regulator/tetratricopeptide (TPR) repeat protein
VLKQRSKAMSHCAGQRRVRREIENLRSALAWSSSEPGEAEAGLALAAAIPRYWTTNDYGSEACGWLRALLALVSARGLRAKALVALGWIETRRGNPSSERVLQESVAIAREIDDPSLLCIGLKDLGFALMEQDHLERARAALEEALELRRTRASLPWNYSILEYLGRTMAALGDFETGIAQLTQAVAEAREQDDPFTLGFILRDLGTVLLDSGDFPAARSALEESLDLRVGRLQVSRTLVCFAGLAAAEGNPLQAFRLAGAATSLRAASHERMPPTADAELERWLRQAHHVVDPRSRDAAWAEGEAMSMDDALAQARETSSRPARPVQLHKQPAGCILTPREREVVNLVARGLTNRQIAAALVISERTVARHVENVLGKLVLTSRVQVAAWAIDQGIARAGQHRTA